MNYYRKVISLRKEYKNTILNGTFKFVDSDTFSYIREGSKKILVINNFGVETKTFKHNYLVKNLLISNYDVTISNEYKLRPYESIVLEVE